MQPFRYLALCLLAAVPVPALAQTPAAAPAQPLPTDPAALLQLAAQVNGLHGSDLKPWHIHATWQKLDNHKHVKSQGAFEEWWAGPDQVKVDLTAPGFHQTRWITANGDAIIGDPGLPSWLFRAIWKDITVPVAAPGVLPGFHLQRFQEKQHQAPAMDCAGLQHTDSDQPFIGKTCFTDGLPAVRFAGGDPIRTTFNSLVQLEGKYVARDIQIRPADMPMIQINVDAADELQPGSTTDFQPPANAVSASPWLPVPGLVPGRVVSGYSPQISTDLRMRHVQGSVLLSLQIDKDGVVRSVEAIAGPIALQQTVIDAVKTWRYSPWTLNGTPVAAQTEFTFSMELGTTTIL